MIKKLQLQDDETLDSVWLLQQSAYRIEAECMQFRDIPPLLETRTELRASNDVFYGWYNSEGVIAGVIAVAVEAPRELHINRLMVRSDHFRRGIARSLMKFVLDERNIDRFVICTGVRNKPALELYESLGFRGLYDEEIAPGVYLRTLEKWVI